MILTHGDSSIKEQLGKYIQKRKVVLHLENYEDNFNFSWKELGGVLETRTERYYGSTGGLVSAHSAFVSKATTPKLLTEATLKHFL